MISPSQRPLPDNTQHSQQTNIQAQGGIRTYDRSRRAAVDLRLRPRGHWDRLYALVFILKLVLEYIYFFILDIYYADSVYLSEQGWEDPWLFFETKREAREERSLGNTVLN